MAGQIAQTPPEGQLGRFYDLMPVVNFLSLALQYGEVKNALVTTERLCQNFKHQTMNIGAIYFNIQMLGIMTDIIWKMYVYFVISLKLSERPYYKITVTLKVYVSYVLS